jgi:hypothetical protein
LTILAREREIRQTSLSYWLVPPPHSVSVRFSFPPKTHPIRVVPLIYLPVVVTLPHPTLRGFIRGTKSPFTLKGGGREKI